ncbi:hypothetical protein ACFXKF_32000 [Streptomyces scopuliridis]|uniref:hypothetical protein n=1 Tax=Streptomyces scopuliridis TaxID=452529 RepID=UPI003684F7C4
MEAELATAVSTLVGLMVSDAWIQAKGRVARFFARGGDATSVDEELQLSQEELVAARATEDEGAAADIVAGLRLRLRRVLQADPGAGEELRLLFEELGLGGANEPVVTVQNTVSGGVQHMVFQGQNFTGLTFHGSDGPAPVPHDPLRDASQA